MMVITKDSIQKVIPILFLIGLIALNMFPPSIIQSNEKTTTLNVVKANKALILDVSHRSYDEFKIDNNEKAFLVFVFNIRVPEMSDNRFNLWTIPAESLDTGTSIDLELGDLPDGCVMGSHYIITDSRGGGEDRDLQFAVVTMFRAGNTKWEIMNPKVTVDNLLVTLNQRLSYWYSPPIQLNVEELLMDESEYLEWKRVLPIPVKIGVIFSDPLYWGDQIVRFAEDDINQYCIDMDEHYDFEFMITSSGISVEQHEHEVQMFDELGLNLLIGGYLSPQAQGSLNYVNERDMLLISPSSTSYHLAFPGDNLFRLSPTDENEARVIAAMLNTKGIKAAVLLRVEDWWTEGIDELIKEALTSTIVHEFESYSYNYDPGSIEASLDSAEAFIEAVQEEPYEYEYSEIAVIFVGYQEVTYIVEEVATGYDDLYSVTWFTASSAVFDDRLISDVLGEAEQLKMIGPMPRPDLVKFDDLAVRYSAETGEDLNRNLSFFIANEYDACWLLAKAIIEVGSMDTEAIKMVLPDIASEYEGVSGTVHLDENGDRVQVDYDLWGIIDGDWNTFGYYTEATGAIWY